MSEQPALSADVTAAWVPIEDLLKAERERDEALAALARVRALADACDQAQSADARRPPWVHGRRGHPHDAGGTVSTYLPPGTPVRVLRPDQPEHATGVVAEVHNGDWAVWVRHCDCTEWAHLRPTVGHIRGYHYDEVEEAT